MSVRAPSLAKCSKEEGIKTITIEWNNKEVVKYLLQFLYSDSLPMRPINDIISICSLCVKYSIWSAITEAIELLAVCNTLVDIPAIYLCASEIKECDALPLSLRVSAEQLYIYCMKMFAKFGYRLLENKNIIVEKIANKIKFALQAQLEYDEDPNKNISNIPHSKFKSSSNICEPFAFEKDLLKRKKNTEFVQSINALYQKREKADFKIIANTACIPAHRFVLASRCEYFSAMFDSQLMKENQMSVQVSNVKAFDKFIKFIYIGDTNKVELSELGSLLEWMDYYQLRSQQLKYLTQTQISESQLNDSNIIGYAQLAENINAASMISKCISYFVKNFQSLANKKLPLSTLSCEMLVQY